MEHIGRRDGELVAAARAGSGAAFDELQRLYSYRLYKRILSITRNREDAEDALQNTFLRAFVAIDSFEGKSQFFTWLSRIAINSALMTIRRRRTRVEVRLQQSPESGADVHTFDIYDTAPNPEEICDLKQRRNRMFSAIERLDPKSRNAIWIWVSQECSMKQMAHTLDVSSAAAKSRLLRARKKLIQRSAV
ncbi:sigma-70 family RNA polymerase sigma factor [Alloacidobacterium dinghuense]|uniref:Sigma-70 family RNA polymerase sigma factor n=1 Tax=Alloacidobacterium dinghuense TaxID=2763107 RepID=A0A7G8BD83_9BACT|nr:sigma-70 family RNA polymerase sigma factor [Alloacidobacterium dinghuense]QNI30503.1 sigma-70 family RNA polymerase sigma factor [Alloacidobacterium dinghuense]